MCTMLKACGSSPVQHGGMRAGLVVLLRPLATTVAAGGQRCKMQLQCMAGLEYHGI